MVHLDVATFRREDFTDSLTSPVMIRRTEDFSNRGNSSNVGVGAQGAGHLNYFYLEHLTSLAGNFAIVNADFQHC